MLVIKLSRKFLCQTNILARDDSKSRFFDTVNDLFCKKLTSSNVTMYVKWDHEMRSSFIQNIKHFPPPLSSAVSGLITATVVSTGNIFSISLRAAECESEPCSGFMSLSSTWNCARKLENWKERRWGKMCIVVKFKYMRLTSRMHGSLILHRLKQKMKKGVQVFIPFWRFRLRDVDFLGSQEIPPSFHGILSRETKRHNWSTAKHKYIWF